MMNYQEVDTNEQIEKKQIAVEIDRVASGVVSVTVAVLLSYIVIIAIITIIVLLGDYA